MKGNFPGPNPEQILDNIAMLYELSLGIGTSLDLQENCDHFVRKIMSRHNLSCFAYLLNTSLRNTADPSQKPSDRDQYHCLYACPKSSESAATLTGASPLIQTTHEKKVLCAKSEDFPEVQLHFMARESRSGIVSTFSLEDGSCIILINQIRKSLYATWELNQFCLLLNKFSRSVQACLNYSDLLKETTARLSLEKRLAQAQRMESLGLLAGGVAHDLGNLLNPLSVYPEMIQPLLPQNSEGQEMLQQIQTSVHQATEMMRDLLAMARTGGGRTTTLPLAKPVQAYFSSPSFLSLQAAHPAVKCQWQLATQTSIRAGNSMITRVILNLVTNAFEELQGSGLISITINDCQLLEEQHCYEVIPAGQYAVLRVEDNGAGIPKHAVRSIFEPFYSSKKLGKSGSGLGLAVVYGIIKDLDGFIDIKTSAEGTAFILYFPALVIPKAPIADVSLDAVTAVSGLQNEDIDAPISFTKIISDEVSLMPRYWKNGLVAAVQSLDELTIKRLLEDIPHDHSQLKDAISALCDQYRFDVLLTALTP